MVVTRDALIRLVRILDRVHPVRRLIVRDGDVTPPSSARQVTVVRRIVVPSDEHVEQQQIEQEHAVAERTYAESKER